MSLSAENLLLLTVRLRQEVGPAFVVTDDFQPGETKDRENSGDTIYNERSGETAFDEAVRTKKVLRGGLRESKWFVRGLDPVEKRRARGLPGTCEEEQKKVSPLSAHRRNEELLIPIKRPKTCRNAGDRDTTSCPNTKFAGIMGSYISQGPFKCA